MEGLRHGSAVVTVGLLSAAAIGGAVGGIVGFVLGAIGGVALALTLTGTPRSDFWDQGET